MASRARLRAKLLTGLRGTALLEPTFRSLIEDGDTEAIRTYLAGATQREAFLIPALFQAIFQRSSDIVECLISAGAPVDCTDGVVLRTPLHCAARNGDIKTVQYLLRAGASFDAKSASGESPLFYALGGWNSRGKTDRAGDDATSRFGSSGEPLEAASPRHYAQIVKLLVDAGASVDSANPRDSILFYAVRVGDFDVLQYLVQHAVDKNSVLNAVHRDASSSNGLSTISALWYAAFLHRLDMVRYLVEAGADYLLPCTSLGVSQLPIHATFLIYPSSVAHDIISYLIGVDRCQLWEKNSRSQTCLHLAAETNNAKCADWLISQGAECGTLNWKHETPWKTALNKRRMAVIGVFLKRESQLYQARKRRYVNVPRPHGLSWLISGGNFQYPADSVSSQLLCKVRIGANRAYRN